MLANHETCLNNADMGKRHGEGVLMELRHRMCNRRHAKCKSYSGTEVEAEDCSRDNRVIPNGS